MSRLGLLIVAMLLIFAAPGAAQEKEMPKPSSLPVEVTAQHLQANRQERQVIFTGEVVAKQGDITLYCDKLTVFSLPDKEEVERMEADGQVRFVQLDRTATADRAIYYQQSGTLVLIGNAIVHQGQNQVSGEEITVYLQEDRSEVKGGKDSGRVRAILFPEKKKDLQ